MPFDFPFPLHFRVHFRIGSIIYGGGQAVLPMLLGDLVKKNCDGSVPPVCSDDLERSWVTTTQFYAGLALVQVRATEDYLDFSNHSLKTPP